MNSSEIRLKINRLLELLERRARARAKAGTDKPVDELRFELHCFIENYAAAITREERVHRRNGDA
jgi:hypothetical protein